MQQKGSSGKRVVEHIRNMLIAGALAAVPVVIAVAGALWVEERLAPLRRTIGLGIPGVGLFVVLAALYVIGLLVSSIGGRAVLAAADRTLSRVPGLSAIYQAWKDILVRSSPEESGVFRQVVLVPAEGENNWELGFTSGRPLPGDSQACCVFVPDPVNPFGGRLMIADQASMVRLGLPASEALKFLVSRGKYLPPDLRRSPATPQEADEAR